MGGKIPIAHWRQILKSATASINHRAQVHNKTHKTLVFSRLQQKINKELVEKASIAYNLQQKQM